jgi:hypothetical protein
MILLLLFSGYDLVKANRYNPDCQARIDLLFDCVRLAKNIVQQRFLTTAFNGAREAMFTCSFDGYTRAR